MKINKLNDLKIYVMRIFVRISEKIWIIKSIIFILKLQIHTLS